MKFLNTEAKKQRRLVHVPMGRFGEVPCAVSRSACVIGYVRVLVVAIMKRLCVRVRVCVYVGALQLVHVRVCVARIHVTSLLLCGCSPVW